MHTAGSFLVNLKYFWQSQEEAKPPREAIIMPPPINIISIILLHMCIYICICDSDNDTKSASVSEQSAKGRGEW